MPYTLETGEPFILFELAGTTYGLASQVVQHMEMIERVTPVPNAPPYVDGIVFSRGQVVPLINLRARFGFERIPIDLRTRLIVVRVGSRTVGLVVDSAREFVRIPTESIQSPPAGIDQAGAQYLAGIAILGERLVLILDIALLLQKEDDSLAASAPHN